MDMLPLHAEAQEPKHKLQSNPSAKSVLKLRFNKSRLIKSYSTSIVLYTNVVYMTDNKKYTNKLTVLCTLIFTQSAGGPISTTIESTLRN